MHAAGGWADYAEADDLVAELLALREAVGRDIEL
jgi:hypothetical protein